MNFIIDATLKAVKHLYQTDIAAGDINLQETRKDFEGQVTIVTFPFTKFSKKNARANRERDRGVPASRTARGGCF